MSFDERVTLIGCLIQKWLIRNNKTTAKPKDVMGFLIEKGIYNHDNRNGGPLRTDLRRLKNAGRTNYINGLEFEEKKRNTSWNFKRANLFDDETEIEYVEVSQR